MRIFRTFLVWSIAGLAMTAAAAPASVGGKGFMPIPGANLVTVVAREYGFDMPASIPAGLTTFLLRDEGKQLHHLMIVRLDEGKTIADFMGAFADPEAEPPRWIHMIGGPNTPMPGGTSNATLTLEAGHYVAFCVIPAPDGKPHIMYGMVRPFTVTPSKAAPAALPKADVHVVLTDYDFKLSPPISAGRHLIEVTNNSSQPHEMVITRFPPGLGNRDLETWAYGPHTKPAPGQAMGGVTNMAPGSRIMIEADFTPGHYGLTCFVPDARDHQPHFKHGMHKEFDVRQGNAH